jgi:large subunit ribosomal protein L31e
LSAKENDLETEDDTAKEANSQEDAEVAAEQEKAEEAAEEKEEIEEEKPAPREKEEEEEEKEEEKEEIVEERVYTIPLERAWISPRKKHSPRAMRILRSFVMKHMKTDSDSIKITNEVNEKIWDRGIEKPPRKIRVRVTKNSEGIVTVHPAEGD